MTLTTKDVIRKIRKVDLKTGLLVDGIISGNYHSVFKGEGIEFSEIREYKLGDDVRNIDWKVSARMNKTYIKSFIEERDLRVLFVVDNSSSSLFGNTIEKKDKILELIGLLGYSAIRNNDSNGLILFGEGIEDYIPPRKGRKHLLKILSRTIQSDTESKRTNIKESLGQISRLLKRKSIVFLISDFLDKTDFNKELRLLRKKHDVIAVRIYDMRELNIPKIGMIELEDEETGERIIIDTDDEGFLERYEKTISDHFSRLSSSFKKNRIEELSISTEEDVANALNKMFSLRKKKMVI